MLDKQFFYDLDFNILKDLMNNSGLPDFRSKQIWQGLYHNLLGSPDQISTLSKELRKSISDLFSFSHLTPINTLTSSDHLTQKTLFELPDGNSIEAVLMRYEERHTLCISSQTGCAMGCAFCATGQMGFKRNLSSGEIIEQVLYYARLLQQEQKQVTNIVIMGMGEPFHNYDAVISAIDRLNDPNGFNLGARRFTISTVGLIPEIIRFSQEKRQTNLAISLHAANDQLRSSLLPINKKYPLLALIQACREYIKLTNRRITFEWALIQGINDSDNDALELVSLIKDLLCHVNIIQLNPTNNYSGKPTSQDRAQSFRDILNKNGIPCTIRLRRGIDIQAGCGQLASKHNSTL